MEVTDVIPWLYVIVLLIGMALHIGLGLYSRRFKGRPVQLPFELLMYICAVWAATFALDISTDSLPLKILYMQIRFLGIPFVSLLLMIIAIRFTGHGSWLTRDRLALLLVIPAITVILAMVTEYTPLLRYNYYLAQTAGGFSVLGFSNGFWFTAVYNPFTYATEIISLFLLLWMAFSAEKMYMRQALLFFIAIFIPILSVTLFNAGISPLKGYDITTSTFAITGLLLALAIFRYRFISIVPIARSTLFERMTDPMLVIDPEGRLADFNLAAENVLGLNRERDLGLEIAEPLRTWAEILECIERPGSDSRTIAVRTGESVNIYDFSISDLVPGPDAQPARLVRLRDITDRQRVEEKLHESGEYLNKLIDYASAPIIVWNPDFTITRFNHAFELLTGRTEQEVIGQRLDILFPEATRAESIEMIRETVKGVRWESVKIPVTASDGTVHTILWNSANILTDGADLVSTIAQGIDITDSERAEMAVRESERKYRNLYLYAQVGLFETSFKDATVLACNQQYADLAGFPSVQSAIGKDVLGLYVNPEDRENVGRILLERGVIENHTVKFRNRTTGKVFWARFSARFNYERKVAEGSIIDITEQKEAEQNLRLSEERYRLILDNMQDAYFRADGSGTITMANSSAAVMYGYPSPEAMIGIPAVSLYGSPEDRDQMLRQLDETGRIADYPGRGRRRDGALFWVSLNVRVTFDKAGNVAESEGFVRDITERKQAEELLRQSEEHHRRLFETMIQGVVYQDSRGNIISMNPAAEQILGKTREEFLGETSVSVEHDTIREDGSPFPGMEHPAMVALSTGKEVRDTLMGVFNPKTKMYRWIRINAVPLFHPGEDRPYRVYTLFDDITDRKQVEEQQARLAAIVEFSDEAIIGKTLDGTITSWNAGAERIYGYSAREVTGRNISLLIMPDHADDSWTILEKIRKGEPVIRYETLRRKKDGSRIDVLLTISPVRDIQNRIIGASTVAHNVTERRRTEEALRESEEKFRLLFTQMSAGSALHEIVNDLSQKPVDYRLLDVNPAFGRILGLKRENIIGKTSREVYGIDAPPFLETYARVASTNKPEDFEVYFAPMKKHFAISVYSHGSGRFVTIFEDITDRKRAEEDLKTTLQRFYLILSTIPYGILLVTEEDQVEFVNQFFCDMFGLKESPAVLLDLAANEFLEKIRPAYADPGVALARIAEIVILGKRVTGEEVHLSGERTVLRDFIPLRLGEKQYGRLWNHIDITERKKAEESLKKSEARFRQFFEKNNAVMIMIDPQTGMILDANPAAAVMSGYPRNVLRTMNITELNKLSPGEVALIRREVAQGIRKSFIAPFRHATGVMRTTEVFSSPVNVEGRTYLFSIIHDITERQAAEEALAESEERLRLALEAANAGTWEWNLITYQNFWSEKVWNLYGIDPATRTASYESWLESVHPDDRAAAAKGFGSAAAEGKAIHTEWRVNQPGQAVRWLESRGKPVKDDRGTAVKYRGIVIDITERKMAEQERETLIRELEQKNAELERFTYTVSHDLKSPLITIKGFAGLIEDDVQKGDPVQLKMDVHRITEAADTMQALLVDVLELSRVGKIIKPPEKTPFGSIVQESVELLAGPLTERGVTVEIAPDLPVVNVDHARIREVLVNLIENAIKFSGTRKDPVIRVGAEMQGTTPVFFVQDNGIGIDPRYLERVFNLFERLDVTTHGTGIGLTIVRRIIEVHGGKIWAESEGPEKGTTFRFTLPGVPDSKVDTL